MATTKVAPLSSPAQFTATNQFEHLNPLHRGGENDTSLSNTKTFVTSAGAPLIDPLWTPEQVARELNVSPAWVRDHSSRKEPRLPVIRLGSGPGRAGLLRYRASQIEKFIAEMERLSSRNSGRI